MEVGSTNEALAEFQEMMTDDCGHIPRNHLWLVNIALLGEICYRFDDRDRSLILYELLQPHAERVVANPFSGWVPYGPAAYYLGLLATTLGRYDEAASHFESAIRLNERFAVRPAGALTRYAWADVLLRRDAPGDHERALDLVNQALAGAEAMGMTKLAEQALALKVRVQGILNA
jgi:tetratricopeptide (TPR) repeat protein